MIFHANIQPPQRAEVENIVSFSNAHWPTFSYDGSDAENEHSFSDRVQLPGHTLREWY